MRLSQKTEYGLRALVELARRHGGGPVQAGHIAAQREIPTQYLPQILLTLRRAGLIRSGRGPHGGHKLARPPEQITLLAAVEALGATTSPSPCTDPGAVPVCSWPERCTLRGVWRRVAGATENVLRGVTLADLASQEQELESAPMYYI